MSERGEEPDESDPLCPYCLERFNWRRKGAIYCHPSHRKAMHLIMNTRLEVLIAEVDRRRAGYAEWLVLECAETAIKNHVQQETS
jgi:hypothetical protein